MDICSMLYGLTNDKDFSFGSFLGSAAASAGWHALAYPLTEIFYGITDGLARTFAPSLKKPLPSGYKPSPLKDNHFAPNSAKELIRDLDSLSDEALRMYLSYVDNKDKLFYAQYLIDRGKDPHDYLGDASCKDFASNKHNKEYSDIARNLIKSNYTPRMTSSDLKKYLELVESLESDDEKPKLPPSNKHNKEYSDIARNLIKSNYTPRMTSSDLKKYLELVESLESDDEKPKLPPLAPMMTIDASCKDFAGSSGDYTSPKTTPTNTNINSNNTNNPDFDWSKIAVLGGIGASMGGLLGGTRKILPAFLAAAGLGAADQYGWLDFLKGKKKEYNTTQNTQTNTQTNTQNTQTNTQTNTQNTQTKPNSSNWIWDWDEVFNTLHLTPTGAKKDQYDISGIDPSFKGQLVDARKARRVISSLFRKKAA